MSSSLNPSGMTPIFTREVLLNAEAAIATTDAEIIDISNGYGKTIGFRTVDRDPLSRDVPPGEEEPRKRLIFRGERALRVTAELNNGIETFFPVICEDVLLCGPNRSEELTRELMVHTIDSFEASDEAKALTDMIKTNLKGSAVDKVILFGPGEVGVEYEEHNWLQSCLEFAAARVIARAAQEVSSAPSVAILAQDFFSSVCKKVLPEFDIEIIECYGAKGFTLVDDNTIAIAHHPSFPFREIIADLARPAVLSMRAQDDPSLTKDLLRTVCDIDSERSREMIKEYREVLLPVSQPTFHENVWYFRK
ncbi:hypothetical protein F5Y10DRAFT_293000 [Nemania abortiva]|nr:hypothetical protein F5Y10DRAFT_293000 [Nemania abortiva]